MSRVKHMLYRSLYRSYDSYRLSYDSPRVKHMLYRSLHRSYDSYRLSYDSPRVKQQSERCSLGPRPVIVYDSPCRTI